MVLQLLSSRGKSRPVFGCKGSGISLNWSITDEVTTDNTTTYFSGPLRICRAKIGLCDVTDRVTVTTGRRRLLFFFSDAKGHHGGYYSFCRLSQQHGLSFPVPKFPIWFPMPTFNPLYCVLYPTIYYIALGYCENTQRCDSTRKLLLCSARMSNYRIFKQH